MRAVFAIAAMGLALVPASAALAGQDTIDQLFAKATEIYESKGYSATGWQKRGDLKEGGEVSYRVTLSGGSQYSIVGMCDTDCSNLDAYLTDSNGRLVDSDVEEDDFPIVAATASGTYTLRLVMKACSSEPCAIGAMAFKN